MISVIKTNLEIEEKLKNKILFLCDYYKVKPKIINGSVRQIDKTNIAYVEPHKIIIKNITLLAFNYSETLYIGNLSNEIKLKNLEAFIKQLK